MDIEGTLNDVTNEAIEKALRDLGVEDVLITWLLNISMYNILLFLILAPAQSLKASRGTPRSYV